MRFYKVQSVVYYYNHFRIAVQRFWMNQYISFIDTKNQPYIFLMLGLRFLQGTGIENPDYIVKKIKRIAFGKKNTQEKRRLGFIK